MKVVIFVHNLNYRCGALSHYIMLASKLDAHFVYFDQSVVSNGYLKSKGIKYTHYLEAKDILSESDIWMVDHFPLLDSVRNLNCRFKKPLIITVHFLSLLDSTCKNPANFSWREYVLCFNTFSKKYLKRAGVKATVLGPLINEQDIVVADFDNDRRVSVGDICIRKGVNLFANIVYNLPSIKFFGVKNYNEIQDSTLPLKSLTNLDVLNFVDPVSEFLRRVKVLLVPSITESWCRIAFEAMYNGIPVIYTKPYHNTTGISVESTEGMEEWIQDGAMSCQHDSPQDWCRAILSMEDQAEYELWSKKARTRALKLKLFDNIKKYEEFISNEIR